MKHILLVLTIALSGFVSIAQTGARPQPCACYSCCPQVVEITIQGTALANLHLDSVVAILPSTGKAVRLVKPPLLRSYHDNTMSFASGETVQIVNEAFPWGDGIMSLFGDALIAPWEGTGSGSFWHSYYMPFNGQSAPFIPHVCDGRIFIRSTFPISGGGTAAKLVLTIWYEEIAY